jgi:hypothetical protein
VLMPKVRYLPCASASSLRVTVLHYTPVNAQVLGDIYSVQSLRRIDTCVR